VANKALFVLALVVSVAVVAISCWLLANPVAAQGVSAVLELTKQKGSE